MVIDVLLLVPGLSVFQVVTKSVVLIASARAIGTSVMSTVMGISVERIERSETPAMVLRYHHEIKEATIEGEKKN